MSITKLDIDVMKRNLERQQTPDVIISLVVFQPCSSKLNMKVAAIDYLPLQESGLSEARVWSKLRERGSCSGARGKGLACALWDRLRCSSSSTSFNSSFVSSAELPFILLKHPPYSSSRASLPKKVDFGIRQETIN